ncbi:3-deoxy-D-manno-octulosonic acid transferase [Octadecabacter ascidiaceicola]|uniref:3-deoxy-D-manno-octulosonic acid transferase n=2 Tax=Octadecabacter ascidiaceicola TaxID=1655543 RepID=A0A238JT13_9RHOB|nr:3-deoxy-D-manno-octulosonic acid transferase [Octadecabacter ascidiaceicola]
MLRLVLGVGAVLSPLAQPLLKRRLAKGKEDPARWREKLGEPTAARPNGPLIWMHGVGVGEVMALRGLIIALSTKRPDLNFLVTSSARSSGEVFEKNLPPRTQHQYLPLDMPGPVSRFLNHWKPDLAVWSDQEVWPRLAVTCARRGIPQAYVAARITDKSAAAKSRFGDAYGDLYRLLDARHAQEDRTASALRDLMGDETDVQITGSLKAAAAPLVCDANLLASFDADFSPVWVVASAHLIDIKLALDAQILAREKHGFTSFLIIAPRILTDTQPIENMCEDRGLTWTKRSAKQLPDPACDTFIADSFGELGTWYRVASLAQIGGTFDATEGHNPWEAVALNCAILHGPRVQNFAMDYAILTDADAARLVKTAEDIAEALLDTTLPQMSDRAMQVRTTAAQGLSRIADDLLGLLRA